MDEVPVLVELGIGPGHGIRNILTAGLSGLSSVDSYTCKVGCTLEVFQSAKEGVRNEHVFKNVMIAEMALTFQRVWDLVQSGDYLADREEMAALKTNFSQIAGVNEDPQLK